MRRTIVLIAGLLVLASATPVVLTAGAQETDCTFPVERTDLTGETVTLEEDPERIVTLNPSAAQTMHEIGAWDEVVGATKHASNLEGFGDVTNISAAGETISNEEVVNLEPDLVLAPNTISNETVSALRGAGLTVYHFREAQSIEDIYRKTRIIGELTGNCEGAEETVSWM
jgi:iron complex transport system substrate-binding protein